MGLSEKDANERYALRELTEMTDIPVSKLRELVRTGVIPSTRVDPRSRFTVRLIDILEYCEAVGEDFYYPEKFYKLLPDRS